MPALRSFALALVLAFCAQPAAAQQPAPAEPAAPAAASPAATGTAPAAPLPATPVAAPEVVTRADETKSKLRQIEARVAPDATENEVKEKLPELQAKIGERLARAGEVLGDVRAVEALQDLAGEWGTRAERLTEWRHALTRRAVAIESELDTLSTEEAIWVATREAGANGAYPAATLERVREVLAAINDTEKLVKKRRTQILSMQNDVAQQELAVSGVLERVDTRRNELRAQIFAPDSPPLWSARAWEPPVDKPSFRERMRDSLSGNLAELDDFRTRAAVPLTFAFLLFLVVLVTLSVARAGAARAAEADPSLAATARIFARPVSAAIVIAVVMTAWWYRRMPGVASDLQSLIVLVPILRILPVELWNHFRPGLFVLAALFVTASLRSWISFAPILDRLLLLVEALVGAGFFLWLTRPEKTGALASIGRFTPAVRPIAAVGLVLLVLSALTNTLGLVSAARVLVRSVLPSAFVAVALYAAVRIVSGALTVALRSDYAQKLRGLREHGPLVRKRMLAAVSWGATVLWVWATLRLFRIADDVWHGTAAVLGAKLELGTMSISLGDVVAFLLTIWVASLLSRFLRFVLELDVLPHLALPRGVPNAISTGLHYAIVILGFVLALGAAGIDLSRFTLLAGAFGVGIGFGMQNIVNNFVSGLILLFERPVQTGDSVDVGGIGGEVSHIGIRATTLRTPEGADVIVPNATFISERVVNWTFSDRRRRVDIDVGVKYGTDPEKVIALLVATGRAHPEVLQIPEPIALLTRFGDNSLDFRLHVWTRFEIFVRVKSELTMAVNAALSGAGMEIPFPQRELHVKVDPGTPTYLLPGTTEGD